MAHASAYSLGMMWLLDWCAVVAWLKTLDYGDVPTWFSSIGGIGALIAASLAAKASLSVLKIETERDKDADERAQRAQADLVAAWLLNETPNNWGEWNVVIANESKVPIYDVKVVVTSQMRPDDEKFTLDLYAPLVPPGQVYLSIYELIRRIVEDGTSDTDKQVLSSNANMRLLHKVRITFRDAAEVKWERSQFGTLSRAPYDPKDFRDDDLI